MRLLRFGKKGQERPGVITEQGRVLDVSACGYDYGEEFFCQGGFSFLEDWLLRHESQCPVVNLNEHRLGPVVTRPSKVIAVGLNYRAHASETGAKVPTAPKIFMKATTAICGSGDDLLLPEGSEHTDYEVELACVIGRVCRSISQEDALSAVAGLTICNDYSERDWQKNWCGQFVKGKSADTFCPLGPYLVRATGFDFDSSRIWLKVNGELRQESTLSQMVFPLDRLVAEISRHMTLLPGDVISTGTPSGVGLGFEPPRFLRQGDWVEYGIDGIGETRQQVTCQKSHD
ncbi:MAG: fumarylacetoacetate hydrolase family protein [Polyangiaceae bacterium]|nr:fumarylacetoacetate hydrolase family protein [Polyangiaceae bacterium]